MQSRAMDKFLNPVRLRHAAHGPQLKDMGFQLNESMYKAKSISNAFVADKQEDVVSNESYAHVLYVQRVLILF